MENRSEATDPQKRPPRSASGDLIAAGYDTIRRRAQDPPSRERRRRLPATPADTAPAAEEVVRMARTPDPSRVLRPPTTTPVPSPVPAGESRRRVGALVAIALVALGMGVVIALAAGETSDDAAPITPVVTVVERVTTEIVTTDEPFTAAAAVGRAVIPSIVTVEVGESGNDGFTIQGSGSGVVWNGSGYIVTNEHVVRDSPDVRAVLADGRIYEATLVGVDAYTDLAVIHVNAVGLTPITVGTTGGLEIGDPAIAIGNPLGLEGGPSLTVGVISAFNREVQTGPQDVLFGMIQTDAPITRGSSGGALVDTEGRLIGITSAVGVSDVGLEGIGFAIPVELADRVAADLIDFGRARHAFLGVVGVTSFTTTADGAHSPRGVILDEVVEGSAAASADLRPDDVITAVNGEAVTTMDSLIITLRNFRVGDDVVLSVLRDGVDFELMVALGERPDG